MNKYTIIIYALIVGAAVLSSVLKKVRKAKGQSQGTGTGQQNKAPNTQPKSLEDILQSLLNEQKGNNQPIPTPKTTEALDDNSEFKFNTSKEEASLEEIEEEKYYSFDTELKYDEEAEDYDQLADHHVHGKGFDAPVVVVEEEVTGEWADIDWKKAIVSAEILRRPEY
jgi:hypothetical protein